MATINHTSLRLVWTSHFAERSYVAEVPFLPVHTQIVIDGNGNWVAYVGNTTHDTGTPDRMLAMEFAEMMLAHYVAQASANLLRHLEEVRV